MAKALTLSQFERLDGALTNCLRAKDHAGVGEARMESRLFDVVIDLVGYDAACAIPSLMEWAAERVTATLLAA